MMLCWVALALAQPAPEVTVDLAEEAELLFRRGLDAYRARRYSDALIYLLASNRIVPNRIVVFDLARTYEEMGEPEAAWRYYSWYVSLEPDEAERADAIAALSRLTPKVARLSITSDPPGAAVYLDSRSLGRRGSTPMELALPEGRHHVILSRDGYATLETDVDLVRGQRAEVSLRLDGAPVAEPPPQSLSLSLSLGPAVLVDLHAQGCRVLGTEAVLVSAPPAGAALGSALAAQMPPEEGLFLEMRAEGAPALRVSLPPSGKRSLVLGDPAPLGGLLFSRCVPQDPAGIASSLAAMAKPERRQVVPLFAEWAAWRGRPGVLESARACAEAGACDALAAELTTAAQR